MENIPHITVKRNNREKSWEVIVDYGRYGRLFHYKKDAEAYAIDLAGPSFLAGELLTRLFRRPD